MRGLDGRRPPPRAKLRLRLSTVRAARRARLRRKIGRTVFEGLMDPLFPTTFFIRNMRALENEPGWNRLPFRFRRNRLLGMLDERASFFLEIKQRLNGRYQGSPSSVDLFDAPSVEGGAKLCDPSEYCTHCGGCCEIAGGLPDFPEFAAIPAQWLRAFGNGLGRGHRFCPFLWEVEGSGNSLCAVHSCRPNPCRMFERDECEFLRRDPAYIDLSHPDELLKGFRSLLRLING
jgi:hypothetical protein